MAQSRSRKIFAGILVLSVALLIAAVFLPKIIMDGKATSQDIKTISVLKENEDNFAKDFSYFYKYEDRRGIMPLTLVGPDQKPGSLDDYKGKILAVHFWATWCPPCITELPTLKALQIRSEGNNFKILTISVDLAKTPEEISDFMKKNNVQSLPALTVAKNDPGWDILTQFGIPTTFIVGPDGAILYKMVGDGNWDSPDARAFMADLLNP